MTSQSIITQQCKDNAWHNQPNKEIQALFAANGPDKRKNGDHVSPFHNFLGQFDILIIWILIVAGVLLALLGGSVEVIAVVLFNAIVFFFQDFNFSMEKSLYSTREDDRPTQHAATRNLLKGSGSELRLIGLQPAD